MEGPLAFAVNGTLMRGLERNANLVQAGGVFDREARTAPVYRLWSIDDVHPAMLRVASGGGASIAVEIWLVPAAGIAAILLTEPDGLCVGRLTLDDGTEVLGVLAEPALVEGQREITEYGGWRASIAANAPVGRGGRRSRAAVREEVRLIAEDAADREEMRAIREQMAELAPAPEH